MRTFKYKITLHSFFQKPEDYIINNLDDLQDLKDYASQNQYKITIQEGEYCIKNGYWYDNHLKTYI
jgi:hypothetical protein